MIYEGVRGLRCSVDSSDLLLGQGGSYPSPLGIFGSPSLQSWPTGGGRIRHLPPSELRP